jgi:hypothetical protein
VRRYRWPCMPRYFFRLADDDSLSLAEDEVGEEFNHVEAARGQAMAVARELSRNQLPDALVGRHISVVDERGVAWEYSPKKLAEICLLADRTNCRMAWPLPPPALRECCHCGLARSA